MGNNNCRHVSVDTIQAITKQKTISADDDEFVELICQAVLRDRRTMAEYVKGLLGQIEANPYGFSAPDNLSFVVSRLASRGILEILNPTGEDWAYIRFNCPEEKDGEEIEAYERLLLSLLVVLSGFVFINYTFF
jgi:hypothetical protein